MVLSIFYIILGFFLLVKGGDFLVDGSVAIAKRAKLSPMVIGLTVIGFGTSSPELIVSTQAALAGSPGIAIGNVVGSNIANVALILGMTALMRPLPASRSALRIDMPIMLIAMVLFTAFALLGTGTLERWQGLLFVVLIVSFTWAQIRISRKQHKDEEELNGAEDLSKVLPVWKAVMLIIVSIVAMIWGAGKLIDGASDIAMRFGQYFGASQDEMERIIGLTIVAVGTSLPELFASVMAARKGQTDMAVGNIIGSVTFNILSVIGVAATICPIADCAIGFTFDYLLMLGLGILLWLFMLTHRALVRWEGAVLLGIYLLFIVRTLV